MPLPVPNLDDRRFDDLVKEAQARLASHLPELARIAPGDPIHALVDLFAWLTETILYRANLVPERQRRVFLNLLQIPIRGARPAQGVVCVDAEPSRVQLPPLLPANSQLRAGRQSVTTLGDVQATPLSLQVLIKETLAPAALEALGVNLRDLQEQFGLRRGETPVPFRPRRFDLGKEVLAMASSLDQAFYLACIAPRQLADQLLQLRQQLAGITLNIAVAPADDAVGDTAVSELNPRPLAWELVSAGEEGETLYLPLEMLSDSSRGGRLTGVVRLRLPRNAAMFQSLAPTDPLFSGVGARPPELADRVEAERVVFWLRLHCPEYPRLELGHLGINGVEVVAQGLKRNLIVGLGTGRPDQVIALPDRQVDAATLRLEIEENGIWSPWEAVDFLAGQSPRAGVYRLDAAAGHVYFGDGLGSGRRPPEGSRIRIVEYRYGGGSAGNLPSGSVTEIADGSERLRLRHEWPLAGGLDAETVEQAERRIPQFLTHRNRAVTRDDFKFIAEANPVNPVARAEVIEGFLPGATLRAARSNVPGVVSVFVLPPAEPAVGQVPKPTRGLLKDVFSYLLRRVLIGTELYLLSPDFVPIAVSVTLDARDIETEQQTLQEVRQALVEYLWPLAPGGARGDGWPMGAAVAPNELITPVARVGGILRVNGLALFRRSASGWRRLADHEAVSLEPYQLPELVGVRVASGNGQPALPDGIGRLEGQPAATERGVPVPVIPDVC